MNDEICFLRPLISCLGLLRRPPNSYIVSGSGSAEAALSSHIEFSQFEPPLESWRPVGLSQATTMEA